MTPIYILLTIWFLGVLSRLAYQAFNHGIKGFYEPRIYFDDFVVAFFWFIAFPIAFVFMIFEIFIELFFFIGRNCK